MYQAPWQLAEGTELNRSCRGVKNMGKVDLSGLCLLGKEQNFSE